MVIAQGYRLIISAICTTKSDSEELFEKFKRANDEFENTLERWEKEE